MLYAGELALVEVRQHIQHHLDLQRLFFCVVTANILHFGDLTNGRLSINLSHKGH